MKGKRLEKEKKQTQNMHNIIKGILSILVLITVIVLIRIYMVELNTEEVQSNEFYQYFGGKKIEYNGVMKITKKGEITQLQCENANIQLDSTPIYYKNEQNKILLPENMAKVVPTDNGKMSKITRFSNLYKEGETIYVQSQGKKDSLENAFLYDGGDLYLFLEETTIVLPDKDYKVSAFSYAIATYKNSIEIYNYEKDEYKIIQTDKNIVAQTNDYEINMSVDTIKYGEKEQLLLKKIDTLP